MKHVIRVGSLILAVFILAACGIGLNIQQDAAGNTVVNVSLPESVVNTILRQTVMDDAGGNASNQFLSQIDSVDMKPGLISVAGKRRLADGTLVDGTFDLSLSAENGRLRASISNLQVGGEPVSQEAINRINERIASDLARGASQDDNSEITSVSITDDALQFVVTIRSQ